MSNPVDSFQAVEAPHVSGLPRGWVALMGLLAVCVAAAFWVDDAAVEFVRANAVGGGRWFAGKVSHWGDWYGVLAVGAAIWGTARYRGNAELQRLVLAMGVCAAISGIGANVVRASTGRTRPNAGEVAGWYGPSKAAPLRKGAHEFQSFPSAHTAVVAGFCGPLAWAALRRRRAFSLPVFLAVSGTLLMAWARVWVLAHHVSDVLAACLLGAAVTAFWMRRTEKRHASSR